MKPNRMLAVCDGLDKDIDLMEDGGHSTTPVYNKVLRTLIEIARREAARKKAAAQ